MLRVIGSVIPEGRGGVSWARRSASVVKVRLRPAFTVILRWKGAQPRKLGGLAISEGKIKKPCKNARLVVEYIVQKGH